MTVQARMKCTQSTDYGTHRDVHLAPVTTGPGNETYSKFTPCGKLELTITNPDAFNQFVPGKVYDVLLSPVE